VQARGDSEAAPETSAERFRLRIIRTTGRIAVPGAIFVGLGRFAEYVSTGDTLRLVTGAVWLVTIALFLYGVHAERRGALDRAATCILVGIAAVLYINAPLETPALAVTGFFLGFPVLLLSALVMAPARQLPYWTRSVPVFFLGGFLARHVIDPLGIIDTPVDLATVAIAGALGLMLIGSLTSGMVDALRAALTTSEAARSALTTANRDLEAARDQAHAANIAKSAFLATMSHELRTPLNAIIGYSELLAEDLGDRPEAQEDVGRVLSAARHLLALISDILDLSKIEAGRMEIVIETVDLRELVDGVIATVTPLAQRAGNRLIVDLDPEIGALESDATKIRQMLLNLAANAAKFTHGGEIRIHAAAATSADGRDGLRIAVADQGIGIAPEKLAAIFQPFVQADSTTTRRYGGTGLGLAITSRFAAMLGGTIDVTSQPGVGSTFTLWLPRRIGAGAALTGPAPAGDGTAGHVLVIDDDLEARRILHRLLTREGLRVSLAASGEEGLQMARELHPDLITLDVLMPGMDGWTVLAALKDDPALADTPVIVLTITSDRGTALSLGAADYIVKPIERDRLLRVVERVSGDGSSPQVLIVDDSPEARELLRRALAGGPWRIREAADGAEALARMAESRPAVVLLDLMMPEIDGFGVLERMRADPHLREVPVVVVTAKTLSAQERAFLSGSVIRILEKGSILQGSLIAEARALLRHLVAPSGAR